MKWSIPGAAVDGADSSGKDLKTNLDGDRSEEREGDRRKDGLRYDVGFCRY